MLTVYIMYTVMARIQLIVARKPDGNRCLDCIYGVYGTGVLMTLTLRRSDGRLGDGARGQERAGDFARSRTNMRVVLF